MSPLALRLPLLPSHPLLSPNPSLLFHLKSLRANPNISNYQRSNKFRRGGICRAELAHDAPFAIAIGACMLNSLVFPDTTSGYSEEEEEEEGTILGPTDARFAVMSIMSFIPYFNWLSWVFALMDTGKRRYAVYAIVYLAPYLRSNLSLSPEESWLPIASIVLCIVHIQLESSIRNGDLDGFRLFNGAARHLSSSATRKDGHRRFDLKGKEHGHKNMLSVQDRLRDGIRKWGMPKKPFQETESTNQETNSDEEKKK